MMDDIVTSCLMVLLMYLPHHSDLCPETVSQKQTFLPKVAFVRYVITVRGKVSNAELLNEHLRFATIV